MPYHICIHARAYKDSSTVAQYSTVRYKKKKSNNPHISNSRAYRMPLSSLPINWAFKKKGRKKKKVSFHFTSPMHTNGITDTDYQTKTRGDVIRNQCKKKSLHHRRFNQSISQSIGIPRVCGISFCFTSFPANIPFGAGAPPPPPPPPPPT